MPDSRSPRHRLGSALGGIFFGLVTAGAGGYFCWYLWSVYQKARAMDDWMAVQCTIVESQIETEMPVSGGAARFKPKLRYRYTAGGDERVGNRVKRVTPQSGEREMIEDVLASFPVGGAATCYVNPANLDDVVLIKDRKGALYALWFPALFVVAGLGLAVSSIFRNLGTRQEQT
jgi:hypothetical protein